jgi:hypothetical protein
MPDSEKFELNIYHDGVVLEMPVRGRQRFLLERAFLDDLTGRVQDGSQRPVPDPGRDLYYFDNDEQLAAYFAFRKKLDAQA